jgi:hypothetical protein
MFFTLWLLIRVYLTTKIWDNIRSNARVIVRKWRNEGATKQTWHSLSARANPGPRRSDLHLAESLRVGRMVVHLTLNRRGPPVMRSNQFVDAPTVK